MHAMDVCWIADQTFIFGVEEAFARHIRALERAIGEGDTGFQRIHVIFTERLSPSVARLFAQQGIAQYNGTAIDGSGKESPTGEVKHERLKNLYIIAGTNTKPAWSGPSGEVIEQAEWHHASIEHRLAVAHELGHVALRHCFDEKGNVTVPTDGWPKESQHERQAREYAVYLVKLSSEYMERSERGRAHTNAAILDAVTSMWKDWAESKEGAQFLMWLFAAAD